MNRFKITSRIKQIPLKGLSVVLALCVALSSFVYFAVDTSAATYEPKEEPLTQDQVKERFYDKMTDLGWVDVKSKTETIVTAVNDAMWHNTGTAQTKWVQAPSGYKISEDKKSGLGYAIKFSEGKSVNDYLIDGSKTVSECHYSEKQIGNATPYLEANTVFTYSIEYDEALKGYYRQYYISSADWLAYVFYHYEKNFSTYLQVTANDINFYNEGLADDKKIGSWNATKKVKVVLLNDLDLGGKNGVYWTGYRNASIPLEIDGQGHSIYNGRICTRYGNTSNNYGFLRDANKVAIYDVNFKNMYINGNGGLFGIARNSYFNNVNFEHCLGASETTSAVGMTTIVFCFSYNNVHLKDCTVDNSYVIGYGHTSMFASYDDGWSNNIYPNLSYIGDKEFLDSNDKARFYYTSFPETVEDVELCWNSGIKSVDTDGDGINEDYPLTVSYPSIYENCASVNSNVYDLHVHSGTFVSCTQGRIIFKNCFTNSVIYSQERTGVFLGAVIGSGDGFYYPYNGKKTFVNTYFENCFTAGAIEGSHRLGGFVGMIFDDYRVWQSKYRGQPVFKNCYSTSTVGMEYTGNNVGGFVGNMVSNTIADTTVFGEDAHKSIFENCYVAGEVGGITTNYSTDPSNHNSIGGFMGSYQNVSGIKEISTSPGNYYASEYKKVSEENLTATMINCYYDKQTTAMHERDIGTFDDTKAIAQQGECLVGSFDGLYGVYTQSSSAKKVKGLTDTVDMNNGATEENAAWDNTDKDYYPMLKVFKNLKNETKPDDYDTNLVSKMKYDRKQMYYYYSLASVSTVLLNHWDQVMNMATGSLSGENNWKPGVPENKLTKVLDTQMLNNRKETVDLNYTQEWNDSSFGDGAHWEIRYSNLADGTYEFKIQEGDSWTYNYGAKVFNGNDNIKLVVGKQCDVIIRFKYDGAAATKGASSYFEVWADYIDHDTQKLFDSQLIGFNPDAVKEKNNLYILGNLPYVTNPEWSMGWGLENAANLKYDPSKDLYTYTTQIIESNLNSDQVKGTYKFKIIEDRSWTTNYGVGGEKNGLDMSLTLDRECEVTFLYDDETHITSVTVNPPEALVTSELDKAKIDFTGYSVIAPSAITGHEWMDSQQALEDGELKPNGTPNELSVSFTVGKDNFAKAYGFKVIKDGIDEGDNNLFAIRNLLEENPELESIDITFTYNTVTGKTVVSANVNDAIVPEDEVLRGVNSYTVLGVEELTGWNWGSNNAEGVSPSIETNRMKRYSPPGEDTTSVKTYENIEPGSYAFKVVAGGSFDNGISYGANYNQQENYEFTLKAKAKTVTITFNETTKRIYVDAIDENGDSVIDVTNYLVVGNYPLTGEYWSTKSTKNSMDYDDLTGLYTKTYEDLSSNVTYAFKVLKYGKNNTGANNTFSLKKYANKDDELEDIPIDYAALGAKLKITYNPRNNDNPVTYVLLDKNDNDISELYITDPLIDFYSVLGETALTGWNWEKDPVTNQHSGNEAAQSGKMEEKHDEKGNTYYQWSRKVKISQTPQAFAFKVVANGTWDMGIDYGLDGDNYKFTLATDDPNVTETNVTITFYEDTSEIFVAVDNDDYFYTVNEDEFEWYIAGVAELVSEDEYTAPVTVYDTVRDITSAFSFTAADNIDWQIDSDRNTESGYMSYLGSDESANGGFSLNYTVEGKAIKGQFNSPVVNLVNDDETNQYSCNSFMPGKQWLVVESQGENVVGKRQMRLIPTCYLEAGTDATINVLQSGSDYSKDKIKNIVKYKNTDSLGFASYTKADGTSINDDIYSYYNYALAAGYVITDRNGLGYYGSYSGQKVNNYNPSDIRKNTLDEAYSNSYFAMSTAYNMRADYNDNSTDKGLLGLDSLQNQCLIGSSYDERNAGGKSYASTIVKIYSLKEVTDSTAIAENSYDYKLDGKYYGATKVFTDNDPSSSNYANFQKWTGQREFEESDEGKYLVSYYWSLSDGRYLNDYKTVTITSSFSEASKTTENSAIELNSELNTINYEVTFANKVNGDFKICDVLPYMGDVRFAQVNNTTIKDGSNLNVTPTYTLKKVEAYLVDKDAQEGDGEGMAKRVTDDSQVTKLKIYYSNSSFAGTLEKHDGYDESGKPLDNIAQSINLSDSTWEEYSSGDKAGVTAIAVSGNQSTTDKKFIRLKFTVQVDGDVEQSKNMLNNAYFSACDSVSGEYLNGYTKPVSTIVVGSQINGCVWMDNNINGRYDSGEETISNIKVQLVELDADGNVVKTVATQVTQKDGLYKFDNITSGKDYKILFTANNDEDVTIYSKNTNGEFEEVKNISLNELILSKRREQSYSQTLVNSRNIATKGDDGNYYILETGMPTANEISEGGDQRIDYKYGEVRGYKFIRAYQNLGLREGYTDAPCALTVVKVDGETKAPLEGVKFNLGYQPISDDDASEVFLTAYVKKEADGSYTFVEPNADGTCPDGAIPAENIETNAEGKIRFTNLPSSTLYSLTEAQTLEGYNLLPAPIEFSLPYYMKDAKTISDDGYVEVTENKSNNYYYYDVTYTITNSKIPTLPITGVENNYILLIAAVVLLTTALTIVIVRKIKNNRAKHYVD